MNLAATARNKSWLVRLAVILPFGAIAMWIAYHALIVVHGSTVEVPIRGYDPRDLLSGHYLRFEIDFGVEPCGENDHNRRVCLCFKDPAVRPAEIGWQGDCIDRPAACGAYIAGYCREQRFVTGLNRYYIPEQDAPRLQVVPDHASVELKLDGRGGAVIHALNIEGQPLRQWLDSTSPEG